MVILFSSLEFDQLPCHLEKMRHEAVYDALMASALERIQPTGYVERHHIKPKSLFPELRDDADNIVLLTAREHFVAHLLLAKIYGGVMSFAAQSMSLHGRYGSRDYAWLREESAAFLSSSRTGEGNPMFGRTLSQESVDKRVTSMMANRGDRPGPLRGRTISQLHRERISAYQQKHGSYWTGRKLPPEAVEAMRARMVERMRDPEVRRHLSEMNTGKTVSAETREKISASNKGRPKPLRSQEHRDKIAVANRRNGERARLRYMEARRPSGTMLRIAEVLVRLGSLGRNDLARHVAMPLGTVSESLDRMELFGWVEHVSRPASRVVFGRTEQRFYDLTETGRLEVVG